MQFSIHMPFKETSCALTYLRIQNINKIWCKTEKNLEIIQTTHKTGFLYLEQIRA